MDDLAFELGAWLKFAGCEHLGFIAVGVGDGKLIIYWNNQRLVPGGMPNTFGETPVEVKQISRPMCGEW